LCVFFLAFFVLAHPVTLIGVFSWMVAPFCAVKAVGICSDDGSVSRTLRVTVFVWPLTVTLTLCLTRTVFFGVHRFPFAASAASSASETRLKARSLSREGDGWKIDSLFDDLLT
jgi:hypothetical protein